MGYSIQRVEGFKPTSFRAVGHIDETKSRFGEVRDEIRKKRKRKWLGAFVESEDFTESGRWYRGLVSDEVANSVMPGTAVGTLKSLGWYFMGGSYCRTTGPKSPGPVSINLIQVPAPK